MLAIAGIKADKAFFLHTDLSQLVSHIKKTL